MTKVVVTYLIRDKPMSKAEKKRDAKRYEELEEKYASNPDCVQIIDVQEQP